jgi:hypothetical protein
MPGTIDQLNFEVILDDKEFTAKVKQDIQLANQLNISLSSLLNIKKQVGKFTQDDVTNNRKAQQILVDSERAQERITREKIRTEGVQNKINAQIERATKGYQSQSRILQELKGYALGYLSIHGVSQLLSSLVRVTGEFELQKTTLAAMLGDLNQAETIIARIQGLAVESPFQFKELTTYAKQLSAFSVPAQELYDTTKMLADISAGLGVGMDRIVLAYGQVRSAAFLRGQEVRQFTEAGIPILDELAKQFSELEGRAVSTGEVFDKISARLVPFEMVAKVMKDLTSEGGKFYQMQEIQAETLKGKISNLKDAYEVMLNEIGKGQSENLKGAVDWARRLMQNYEEIGRQLAALVVSYGVYKTTLLGLEVVTKTFTAANHGLINSLMNAGKWLVNNPYAAIAAAITAAGYATYQWATYLSDAEKIQKSVADSNKKYNETLASEYSMLNALYAKLELYTEGTLEHDKAKAQLMQKYHPYLEQLRQEGVEVSNLANIYGNLVEKIREKVQSTFYESSMQDLEQTYKDAEDKAKKMLSNSIKANAKEYILSEKDKLALSMYVLGGMSQEKAFEKMTDSAKEYFKEFNVFLDRQRSNMLAARDAYIEGMDDISDAYQSFQEEAAEEPINLTLFAKTVQDTLAGFGATKDNKGKLAGLWADNKTEYYDYLDKLRKGYEEVKQKIKDVGSTQKANLPDLEKQKQAIEAIAKALKISLDKGDYGKGKSQAQIDLEAQIDLVKKLQDAYEKLEPFVDDKTMKSTLSKFFPDAKKEWIDSLDFTTVLKSLADELEKYDKDAAERLRNSIGKTGIEGEVENLRNLQKGYKESAKAAEQYFNTLRKWASEDFNLNGEGIALDVSKIASDLNAKMNEIELRATKAKELFGQIDVDSEEEVAKVKEIFVKEFGEDAWNDFWKNYYTQGTAAIDRLTQKQKEYEKKLAQEKVNDLAQKYARELTQGINLSDWGDKNLSQIKKIGNTIVNLYNEIDKKGINLSEKQKESLKSLGLTTEVLIEAIKKILSGNYQETTVEKFKKIQEKSKEVVSVLGDVSQVLTDLGGAVSSDFLVGFSKVVKSAEEFTNIILDCDALWESMAANTSKIGEDLSNVTESKDWITMIVKVVLLGIQKISEAISQTSQFVAMQNELWTEYEKIQREIQINEHVSLFDTLFGKDSLGELKANAEVAKDIIDEILDLSMKAVNGNGEKRFGWLETDPGWWASTFAGGGNIERFKLDQLFEDNGLLSEEGFKKLKAFIDTGELTKESKELGDTLLDYYEKYNEAVKQIDGTINELFNTLATDVADNMISSFLEIGDATANLAEGFDNVREAIGRMILESALVSTMKPYVDDISKSFEEYLVSGDSKQLAEDLDFVLSGLEALLDSDRWNELTNMLKEKNLLGDSMDAQSLGDGIKGITEDTANLLASYLNAIRADVSYARTIWERMDVTTQQIAVLLSGFSAPSLMEYQAQIAANTYNTAMNTQSIMEDLRSVITSTDGPTGIRVYS